MALRPVVINASSMSLPVDAAIAAPVAVADDRTSPNDAREGVSLILLRARDVVLASYHKTSRHPGNIRLNNLILSSLDEFYAIPKKKKTKKSEHYAKIIKEVEKGGTRFLVPEGSGYALATPVAKKNAVKQRIQRKDKGRHRHVSDAELAGDDYTPNEQGISSTEEQNDESAKEDKDAR